jgi:hypothetical protein
MTQNKKKVVDNYTKKVIHSGQKEDVEELLYAVLEKDSARFTEVYNRLQTDFEVYNELIKARRKKSDKNDEEF